MKKKGKIILYILIALVGVFAFFVIYTTVVDYSPKETIVLSENNNVDELSDSTEISILTWNIGYCGLSADMDFFYDGGKQVRPKKEQVEKNVKGILSFLKENEKLDFILLQEVDKNSHRSYNIKEFEQIQAMFPDKEASFGKNYDVPFIPIPITQPMGGVKSGILTLSNFKSTKAVRYQFPGNYAWPKGLFLLDRCFVVNRYPVSKGKEFLVINTHNSAYDDGTLKAGQMAYLKKFLEKEYQKGNYIIVGGDWNQCPPEFEANFKNDIMDNTSRTNIDKNYLKKWTWLYDNAMPTNRRLLTDYQKGKTLTTVIDFFLLSPNIEPLSVKNIDVGFKYSDHQPVKAKFRFN